jgi:hypothetical protein
MGVTMLSIASPAPAADVARTPSQAGRAELVTHVLNYWEPIAVEVGAHSAAWRDLFATQLKAMDTSALRSIDLLRLRTPTDAKAAYAQFTEAIRGAEMQLYQTTYAAKVPAKLGSTTTDQVFIPIVPCRIVDTRNVGGMIAAGTTRNFYFYASSASFDWSTQGGAAGAASSTCPGTINPNGGAPSAAVVTVTVVSPSAAGNWIIWGGASPTPTISALNWNAGDIAANTTIIQAGGRGGSGPGGTLKDFAVAYNGPSGSAHFIADVVGYLTENQQAVPSCLETTVLSKSLAQYHTDTIVGTACPSGYTLTGGNCDSEQASMRLVGAAASGNAWRCTYYSYFDGLPAIYASSICCRIPGR